MGREHKVQPVTAVAPAIRFGTSFAAWALAVTGLVSGSLVLGIIIVELFCYFFVPGMGRAEFV
jgi:hypothetical protein